MNLLALIVAASMMATPHPKSMMTHGHAMHSSVMHRSAMHAKTKMRGHTMHSHMMAAPTPKP